jgi:hypothetical protein
MSGRWWRAYSRARHDPKLLKLSDKDFRWWFNLVCVAADNGGALPYIRDLAAEFRTSEQTITVAIERLRLAGLFEIEGEPGPDVRYIAHNWNVLQYVSDSSSNRVKRFRERQLNDDETFQKRPQRTETEAETETDSKKGNVGAIAPSPTVEAVEVFNALAAEHDWPKVQVLNTQRKRALDQCLKAVGGPVGWQTLLAKVTASDFLMGRTRRSDEHVNWRFDFDFLVKPKRYIKLMEGGYDNPAVSSNGSSGGLVADFARAADMLRDKQYSGL